MYVVCQDDEISSLAARLRSHVDDCVSENIHRCFMCVCAVYPARMGGVSGPEWETCSPRDHCTEPISRPQKTHTSADPEIRSIIVFAFANTQG